MQPSMNRRDNESNLSRKNKQSKLGPYNVIDNSVLCSERLRSCGSEEMLGQHYMSIILMSKVSL